MPLLTTCCFVIPLRTGVITLIVFYWWISVTYVVLLLNYLAEHSVLSSVIIGLIFVFWVVCDSVALYGLYLKNPHYLIPQLVSDFLDCVQRVINLVYHMITGKLVIPRYTTFGSNWRGDVKLENESSFYTFMYNLFDERYPLPDVFAAGDLVVRIYLLLVIVSYYQDLKKRQSRKRPKKKDKKTSIKKATTSTGPTVGLKRVKTVK